MEKNPVSVRNDIIATTFSICPTLSLPYCVHKPILYIQVSIPSLHIDSSMQLFRLHLYVLIYNICSSLSDLLHSV